MKIIVMARQEAIGKSEEGLGDFPERIALTSISAQYQINYTNIGLKSLTSGLSILILCVNEV